MNRGLANTRQIEGQKVEAEREITGSEAEEILRRYGHNPDESFSTHKQEVEPVKPAQTFEEMVAQEEAKKKAEQDRIKAQNGPNPIAFEGQDGYESHTKYGSDDELGFGFKIEISTDMKIPKY